MLSRIYSNRTVTPGGITHVRPGAQSRDRNAVRGLELGVITENGIIEPRIVRKASRQEVPGRLGHHIPELLHGAIRLRRTGVGLLELAEVIRHLFHTYSGQQFRMPLLLTPSFASHFFNVVAIRLFRVGSLIPLCHSGTLICAR